ncbi:MAG TPA: DUF4870 domain-containing protein [Actinomycetales bacterium]
MSQTPPDQPYGQAPQPPYQQGSQPPQQPGAQPPYPQGGQPPYQQGGYRPPASGVSASDERLWGLLAHLAWIAGSVVAIAPLGPLVVFLIYKDRSPFVREHAAEAINLWITVYIAMAISIPLMVILVGFVTFAAAGLAGLILSIVAAVAANRGERYRYPLIRRLVH